MLAGAGGALLLVALFFPWFGKVSPFCEPLPGFECGRNFDGWSKLPELSLVLLVLAALAGLAVAIAGASPKTDAAVASAALTAPVATVATLLVLYHVLDPVGSLDTRYGAFLGLAACAAITYGSLRAMRDERPPAAAQRDRPRSASLTRSRSSSG